MKNSFGFRDLNSSYRMAPDLQRRIEPQWFKAANCPSHSGPKQVPNGG